MEKDKLLQKLYVECIEELNSIGISVKDKIIKVQLSKRNNKRYGCCKPELPDKHYKTIIKNGLRYIIKYENYKEYTIEISKWVMDLNECIIKNTIMHELIHCMPYCTNHGKHFKQYAKMINENLGYNIARVGNKEEDFKKSNIKYSEKEEYKYKIQCKACGQLYYRKRLEKNFTKKYRCGKCGKKLTILNKMGEN